MWFWNINGFAGAEADVLAFIEHKRPDVLVLIDSQLTDKERVKRSLPGWQLLHESRPHSAHKKKLFGGITVMWQRENVSVKRESGFPKGVLSFVVQDVAGQRKPVAVVALYSPPASSRFNRFGRHWSRDIMHFAEEEVHRLWSLYGFVVAGGDYNWRLGTLFRRCTDDKVGSAAGARTALAHEWHLRANLRPLYGQVGQHRGVCTSRTDSGTGEPDGVSVCKQIPPGWAIQALPPPAWELYSSRGGVHRPLGCSVTAPAVPEPEQQRAEAPPASASRLSPPAHGSQEYFDMAEAVKNCVESVATQLHTNSIDTSAAFSSLADGLNAIQERFFVPSSAARRAAARKARPPATRASHRRNPTERVRRLASGLRVSPSVQKLLKRRRKLVSDALSAKSQLKHSQGSLDATELVEANRCVEDMLREANAMRRQAQRQIDGENMEKHKREATRLSHMLRRHPRKFYRLMQPKLPQPFEVFDESAGPSAAQRGEFRGFFAQLLRRVMRPAGVGEKYRACVPQTDPETMPMLLANLSWEEVYAVLYPAHPKACRRVPCLQACELCPLHTEHVDNFKCGDTHMQQPEHKPRLWTSKSAGPDGVFAETLRWVCPKEHSERHTYRRSVSVALASIFNRVLTDGTVPECPQFAEATMTALYKGVGDRSSPTNYRGICVPNVLAKLFGLVLGTRLSHWAVVNGVVSPAQTGFVVLHGCEYHVFTLLELLRQRVRHSHDTILVFIDFKKAYDSVPQDVIWEILDLMGVPAGFSSLLKSWTAQSRITLCVGGELQQPPFPQETGVPQGGVLSPILFNIVMEVLLRYVNAHAADLGVKLSAEDAARSGASHLPAALQLLALAYADDVVLICPDTAAAQAALDLVQEWSADFGMTIGVGQGKTEAMLVSAATVKLACANDVNGMPKKCAAPVRASAPGTDPSAVGDPDDDSASFIDDDEPCDEERDDPAVVPPEPRLPQLRKGQAWVNGELRGAGTGKPLPYTPRPLPPLPDLPPLHISFAAGEDPTPVPWTNLYKYLGFMLRSDLLDDHAYERVEKKTKAAAERLFPHHRLVRSWPLGQKLQLLQTIVLSISTNVMPLLSSMRCVSESKTKRLDQLWKKIARSTLRLPGSARFSYVVAESGLGDVTGMIMQHRLRLQLSLELHPLRNLAAPPIACQVLDIAKAEAACYRVRDHSLLLAPWPFITDRVAGRAVSRCSAEGLLPPERRYEVPPYTSVVARFGERQRWVARSLKGLDFACHAFAWRPPPGAKQQTAALHWASRLDAADLGCIPKLTPLSARGPHSNGSIVALSRLLSDSSHVITMARQGNKTMHRYPFANSERVHQSARKSGAARPDHGVKDPGAIQLRGKSCHLCSNSDDGPGYDLWHVLFECSATHAHVDVVAVRQSCVAFLPQLCDAIEEAVRQNGASMSNTEHAGVSHRDIVAAVNRVRDVASAYNWDSVPGRWLSYTLLLALPFPKRVVRPDAEHPVWLCAPKRRVKGVQRERNLVGMPADVPLLADDQYLLPELVGAMFDCIVLAGDALRPVADIWCRHALNGLFRVGHVVRPLRDVAERARAAARVAAALKDGGSVSSDQRTTSFVSSSDSDAGSGSTEDSVSEP